MTSLSRTEAPIHAPVENGSPAETSKTYAQTFAGVRQDSGDPAGFVKMMRDFYDSVGIKEKKIIVFSDSLNIELCLEYMQAAEEAGFQPTFGVGTFFTSMSHPSFVGTISLLTRLPRRFRSRVGWQKIRPIEHCHQAFLRRWETCCED